MIKVCLILQESQPGFDYNMSEAKYYAPYIQEVAYASENFA